MRVLNNLQAFFLSDIRKAFRIRHIDTKEQQSCKRLVCPEERELLLWHPSCFRPVDWKYPSHRSQFREIVAAIPLFVAESLLDLLGRIV